MTIYLTNGVNHTIHSAGLKLYAAGTKSSCALYILHHINREV